MTSEPGFNREKFLGLKAQNQARRLADLLLSRPPDIHQYNRFCDWIGRSDKKLPDKIQDDTDPQSARRRLEFYIYWRREAGLGPEAARLRELSEAGGAKDLPEPRAAALKWDVLAHNIRSGHNLGSVIRVTDCMGLGTVHLSGYTPAPDAPAVAAAAMGAETWVPTRRWTSAEECLNAHTDGPVIALETTADALALDDFIWPRAGLLLLGNEELGLEVALLRRADFVIQIPMYGRKHSMNLAIAYALVARDIRMRQS